MRRERTSFLLLFCWVLAFSQLKKGWILWEYHCVMDWHQKSGKIPKPANPKKPWLELRPKLEARCEKRQFWWSWRVGGFSAGKFSSNRPKPTEKPHVNSRQAISGVSFIGVLFFLGGGGGGETLMITLRQPKIRGKADPSEEELHPRSRWRLGSRSLAKSWKAVEWWCNSYSFPNLKTCICIPYIYIYIMVYINKGEASPKMIFFPFFSGGIDPI